MPIESAYIQRALDRWDAEMRKKKKIYIFPAAAPLKDQKLWWKILEEEKLKVSQGKRGYRN